MEDLQLMLQGQKSFRGARATALCCQGAAAGGERQRVLFVEQKGKGESCDLMWL